MDYRQRKRRRWKIHDRLKQDLWSIDYKNTTIVDGDDKNCLAMLTVVQK